MNVLGMKLSKWTTFYPFNCRYFKYDLLGSNNYIQFELEDNGRVNLFVGGKFKNLPFQIIKEQVLCKEITPKFYLTVQKTIDDWLIKCDKLKIFL